VTTRVRIDLNVRVRGHGTYAGLEDVDGPVASGDLVQVFEPESDLEGEGRITEVDLAARLVYLTVDWNSLRDHADASESGLLSYATGVYHSNQPAVYRSGQAVAGGRSGGGLQKQLVQASAVPSVA
jgi:hypothetical protein